MPYAPTNAELTPHWHSSFIAASQVLGLKGDEAIALLEPPSTAPDGPDAESAPTALSQMFSSAVPRDARVRALAATLRAVGLSLHALDAAQLAKGTRGR